MTPDRMQDPTHVSMEDPMRLRLTVLTALTLAAACGGTEGDSSVAEELVPAGINLAEIAGIWTTHGMNEAGDSTIVTYEVMITSNTEGWTTTLEGREPMATRVVAVAGDSVMTESGPFESVLRPGVTVTTTATMRLENGNLVGTFRGNYSDGSVLNGRLHAVRKI